MRGRWRVIYGMNLDLNINKIGIFLFAGAKVPFVFHTFFYLINLLFIERYFGVYLINGQQGCICRHNCKMNSCLFTN